MGPSHVGARMMYWDTPGFNIGRHWDTDFNIGAATYPANASPEIVKMIDLLSVAPGGQPFVDILVNLQIANVDLLNNARAAGRIDQQAYLDLVNWLQIARNALGAQVDTFSPAAVAAKQMTAAQLQAAAAAAQAAAATSRDMVVQKDAKDLAAMAANAALAANDPTKSIVNILPQDPTGATAPGAAKVIAPESGATAAANPETPFYKQPKYLIGGGVLAAAALIFLGRRKG